MERAEVRGVDIDRRLTLVEQEAVMPARTELT